MHFINRYLGKSQKKWLGWMLLAITLSLSKMSATAAGTFLASGEVVYGSRRWSLKCRGSTVAVLELSSVPTLSLGRTVVLLEPKGTVVSGLPVFLVRAQHAPWEVQTLGTSGTWNPSLYSGPKADWSYVNWAGTAKKNHGVELGLPQAVRIKTLSTTKSPVTADLSDLSKTTAGRVLNGEGGSSNGSEGLGTQMVLEPGSSLFPQELSIRRHDSGIVVRITAQPGSLYTLWAADDAGQKFEKLATGQIPISGTEEVVISPKATSKLFTVSINPK